MRQTKKLIKAREAIRKYGLTRILQNAQTTLNAQESADFIYKILLDNNFCWNSQLGTWDKVEPPAPPKTMIEIRIRTGSDWLINSDLLSRIERAMDAIRLKQINKSKPYPQRPPNHADSAIYYQFIDELKP
jgi:hypothetical protein